MLQERVAGVLPGGEARHPDLALLPQEEVRTPLGGLRARLVAVVHQDHLLGIPAEDAEMLGRQRGAEGGHGPLDAVLARHDDVGIALHQVEAMVGGGRLLREVQAVEPAPLAEERGLRRVQVLRFGAVERAGAEADHLAPRVDDREHQPVAEPVVVARPLLAPDRQAGLLEQIRRIPVRPAGGQEPIPRRMRVPQPEIPDAGRVDPARLHVGAGAGPLRGIRQEILE
jgi:hypothetical protein